MYAPSQWETSLQCNDVSHWLPAYLDWSLYVQTTHTLPSNRDRSSPPRTFTLPVEWSSWKKLGRKIVVYGGLTHWALWIVNSLCSMKCGSKLKSAISRIMLWMWVNEHFLWSCSQVNVTGHLWWYRKISNISHSIPKLKCFSSRLALVFAQYIEASC